MSDESACAKPEVERGKDDQGAIVDGAFLEARREAAKLLEPGNTALDDVATAVGGGVKERRSAGLALAASALVAALRDDVTDVPLP